jgi:hypothetical protein
MQSAWPIQKHPRRLSDVPMNQISHLISFHPQMVFLTNLSVNLRAYLCGVVNYASAQALDFLDLGQKSSFLNWKHQKMPVLGNGFLWTGTN